MNIVDRPISIVNGGTKDLDNYNKCEDSITFIQYQAGAYGLNLQLANKIIYFTPPLSSELFEQSKKRIHRIKQTKTCFYYYLNVKMYELLQKLDIHYLILKQLLFHKNQLIS